MKEHDNIKELFSEKLGNYSAPVKPELWNAIAANVAAGSTVATTGTSLLVKSIIGISAASVIGITAYFVSQEDVVPASEIIELTPTTVAEKAVESPVNVPGVENEIRENNPETPVNEKVEVVREDKKEKAIINEQSIERQIFIDDHTAVYVPKVRKTPTVTETINNTKSSSKEGSVNESSSQKEDNSTKVEDNSHVKKPVYLAEITLLPNSFTPNGDRVNDEFYIEFTGQLIDFNIVILDKSNRTVFESKDPYFKWNGMNRTGEMAPSGMYYYIVTAADMNGNPINQYNSLSVER